MTKSQRMKTRKCETTEGSVYQAWCPMFGQFDIRWAAELPPFGKRNTDEVFDKDLDYDLDEDIYD